jgi:hypothetical protein
MDVNETARSLVVFGGLLLAAMGALHSALSIADGFNARNFTPLDDDVRRRMSETSVRFSARLNMWKSWIGFNVSHGLGAFAFGATYSLIAIDEFTVLNEITPLLPLGVFVSFAYFLLALRYWFYGPAIGTGIGFACFAAAYMLV